MLIFAGFYSAISGFMFALAPAVFLEVLLLPIAVVGLLAVWALPDTDDPPETIMRRAFFCYVVAIIVWPYYLAFQIPGLPLVEPRRVASFITLGALLIGLSVSPTHRQLIADSLRNMPWFKRFFLLYIFTQVITIALSPEIGRSFAAVIRDQIANTAMFFVAVIVFHSVRSIEIFSRILITLGAILSLLAFLEFRNEGILWANHIPSFLQVNDPAMENLLSPVFRVDQYRVTMTFSVSQSFAEFLSLTMPFVIRQIVFGRTFFIRAVAVALDLLILAGILLTQARLGLIGATAAHATFGLIWAFNSWRTRPNDLAGPALVLGAVAGAIGLALSLMFVPAVYIRLLGGGSHYASNEGRMDQLAGALELLMGQGLVGYGPDQAAEALNYRNRGGELSIDLGYARVLLDNGVLGLIGYVGIFASALVRSLRLSFKEKFEHSDISITVASVISVWLVSRLVLAQNDSLSLVFIVLGMTVAIGHLESKGTQLSNR